MADTTPSTAPDADRSPGFPFITVGAAFGVLFAFLFLMWLVTNRESALEAMKATDANAAPKPDAATKLDEVRARNEAALNGVGAKMSRDEAHSKLLAGLKGPTDKLPFPAPGPVPPAAAKKDEPKK